MDAFVYDDDDLDVAVEEGKMSRSYCTKCGSRQVKDLGNYITSYLSA